MPMKKYVLLLLVLPFCLGLYGKDLQRKINWENSEDKGWAGPVANFNGAYINEFNLPVYFETLAIDQGFSLKINNLVFENSEKLIDTKIANKIPSELNIQARYIQSVSDHAALLEFIPLVFQDGQLKKLISFDIEVVEKIEAKSATVQVQADWKTSSVLASGKWVKVKTSEQGIHKITYDQLRSWGFTNPANVNLYGNGGYMLPKMNSDFYYDDLEQNAVWHDSNSLFFYSTGTIRWKWDESEGIFKHELNDYSDNAFYYLTDSGNTKIVETLPRETGAATHTVTKFNDFVLFEEEKENLIKSGRRWFGQEFNRSSNKSFPFSLDNLSSGNPITVWVEGAARSSNSSFFEVSVGGTNRGKINFQAVKIDSQESLYASLNYELFTINNPQSNFNVELTYQSLSSKSNAWLDFIIINYIRELTMDDDQLIFRDITSYGDEKIANYELNTNREGVQIWDITDFTTPKAVVKDDQGGQASFKASSSERKEFIAFYPNGNFPNPEFVENVKNQNLHAGDDLPEMIIITHPNFKSQAEELKQFHFQKDGMSVQVFTPELIYNEFSGGLPDAAGIRNFLRMCYERGNGQFKYVLLFGDGSYDNKDILGHGHNFLPTYQSVNSLLPVSSFVTDDFFALMDPGEGEFIGLIDLGIGRIPANTVEQAQTIVNKIKNYVGAASLGSWRNVVCFIGDDGDNNTHMIQAERIANRVNEHNPEFFTDKIYFDAYPKKISSARETYPDVNVAINNRVKNGALIINYTGHANDKELADEKVLGINDINRWSNYNKLPIFVTATCEISRFDLEEESSGGEYILFNRNGGGIGLFSTTRLVFSGSNFLLNREFYEHVFSQDENGNNLRMGEIMRRSKNGVGTGINKRNFTLLADPALKLSYPKHKVITETINGKPVGEQTETISALSTVTIKGRVTDHANNTLDNFNGELVSTIYDKSSTVQTIGNGGQPPMNFKIQNNIIYKGVSTVTNGIFEFTFIVPKDISLAIAPGKIIYYADNGLEDAQGYTEDFNIGGSSGIVIDDHEGPKVNLYLNDKEFKDGDEVGTTSILYAEISDEHGVNTVGTGIGHDITAVLNDDYNNIIVLNDFYLAEKDSYKKGKVIYPLQNLSVGEHTLKFKVWDVLNNSTEVEIRFKVTASLKISSVYCYPNPLSDFTNFVFEHNRPDETFDTRLEIYDLTGSLMDIISQSQGSNGNVSFPILWQVNSSTMIFRQGTYLYRVTIVASDGASSSKSGKMVITKY